MNLKKEKSGYTLLEVLISFAIFGILLGTMVFGFRDTKNIEEFRTSIAEFASKIKEIQNWSLTGQEFGGEVPVGGYGLHLKLNDESDQYLKFSDFAYVDSSSSSCKEGGNQRYDGDSSYAPQCSNDKIVGSGASRFGKNIVLRQAKINYPGGSFTILNQGENKVLDLAFQNFKPFPYVGINSSNPGRDPNNQAYDSKKINTLELYFKERKISMCRKITVFGASGLVQEEAASCP